MLYLGDFPTGATIRIPFHTFNSSGASVTITGLAVTDIEVYKNGSVTQRASDAGYTLLDTDGIDFDGITGIHGFSIDTSDNTDAGFYVAAADYWVVVSAITADSQTVSFVAAIFSIENRSITANMTQISGDSTAADNLETAFDDTAGPVPWLGIVDQGTAQSASGTGLVLRAAAAFADDTLIGCTLAVYGSTQGYWQFRQITDNALSGDAVTVDTWTVTPSGTITYKIFGGAPASATLPPAVNVTQWKGSTAPDMTGDAYARLGAPAGASIAADIAVIESQTDDIGAAGAGLTALASAADLATVAGYLDTEIAAILADTNELQTDWVDGGRLDLLIDAIKAKTDSLTFTVASTLDCNVTHAEGQSTVDGLAINVLLQRIHSYLWSKRSGLNGTDPDTVTIRNFADTADVGTITFDGYGNNTAST